MIIRIDPVTAHRVHLILANCRIRGTDPVAALDAAGLLQYPAQQAEQRRTTVTTLWALLETMTPTMLGDGIVPATAADMKRCILEKIKGAMD